MSNTIKTFRQDIEWIAGGAQGNFPGLYDGEQYLCAVRVHRRDRGEEWWEFAAVTVRVDDSDEDPEAILEVDDCGWGWTWEQVDWYVPIKFLAPPVPIAAQPEPPHAD